MSQLLRRGEQAHAGTPRAETEVSWAEARKFMQERLHRELRGRDGDQLEDLTQEALTRLLRAIRKEAVQNLEALMNEIARRTAIDHFRRRRRWAALVEPLPDSVDGPALAGGPAADQLGDPVERLRFVVLEFFASRASGCHDLALAYFEERNWRSVAQNLGRSCEAVRRQWSRCVASLRAEARDNPGLLLEWTSDEEVRP